MTLSNYDPKLLEFLYELTKLDKVMSYKDIARSITIQGKKVSPKTVERWFKFLRTPYEHSKSLSKDRFDYFPQFSYEKLGLSHHYVILEGADERVLKEFPYAKYQNYALWLFDSETKKSCLTISYPLPLKHVLRFKESWSNMKKEKLIKNYDINHVYSGFMIYSPWHKVVNENGIFYPENNIEQEIERQIFHLKNYINNLPENKIIPEIKRNPLILPVIFENHFKSWSSQTIWEKMKAKLGERVWDYVRKKDSQGDGVGIKRVQLAVRSLHNSKVSHQMKVVYLPLQLNTLFIFSKMKFKSREDLLLAVKNLAMNSIQMTLYPQENNELFLIISTNHRGVPRVFEIMERLDVKKIRFLQHEKSLPLLTSEDITKFNYGKLFDTKKLCWK